MICNICEKEMTLKKYWDGYNETPNEWLYVCDCGQEITVMSDGYYQELIDPKEDIENEGD